MAIVRVYTDYIPIRILKNNLLTMDELAEKMGMVGNFVDIDEENLPKDKSHRSDWRLKDGKVEPDPIKVQAKIDARLEKEKRRISILAKLKLSEDELADILEG